MSREETAVFMNMCMVCRGEQVVVIERRKPDWPGITFPGGHVERNEPFVDSIIREIQEETGLTIADPFLCGITDWCDQGRRYVVFLYKATSFTGTLQSSDEGEVRWVDLAQLPRLKLSSGMEGYLRVFTQDTPSELYYRKIGDDWAIELK